MARVLLLLVLCITESLNGFINAYPKVRESFEGRGDPGSPLFFTPYIERGDIEEARKLSQVAFPGFPQIKSYAGFFTVDKTYNSNQFLWYFPAEHEQHGQNQSVLYLWLQGGPGASSLFGLFTENGPFKVNNGKFELRDIVGSWSSTDHVIYIDNPVGTGFSFTNDSRGYCTDQTQIGEHLHTTLTQFFQLFPELQKYAFIISGESYAGKYIPALGYTIHKKNPTAKVKINLKGMMIGNGWCDPINQLDYSDYLYQIGLLDWNQKIVAEVLQNQAIAFTEKQSWRDAAKACDRLYNFIENCMPYVSIYNYLQIPEKNVVDEMAEYSDLLQDAVIRKAIHVGNLTFPSFIGKAHDFLYEDLMKSVAPWISELLEHYPMLFYNGQTDIIVAYPLTVNFLRQLKFSGSKHYLKAKRELLITQGNILGSFIKRGGKLTEAVVRNAGHPVPQDQPYFMSTLKSWWLESLDL